MSDKRPDSSQAASDQAEKAEALALALASADARERDRLSRIMDLLPCYVVIIDQKNRILFHNKTFEEYFGRSEGGFCYAVLRGQERACRFCAPHESLSGRSSVMEWVHPNSNRAFRVYSYPFTDTDGAPCVLKVGFNITASARMRQALDLSEQSYRAITDNLSIGIALLDPERRIKAGNNRLGQWFGDGFRVDRPICELLQCESVAQEDGGARFECKDCPFAAALEDGVSHEKELTITLVDGKERNMRLVTCPVKSGISAGHKKVRAFILMLEDITARLEVTQRLQRARKIESMSTLAAGIAHEINQPLSALHLYASGLQMLFEAASEVPLEKTQERLGLIMQEADKIRSIITHMRTIATQEGRTAVGPVFLDAAIESALGIMSAQFRARGISARVELGELPPVSSNEVQMEQVLVNLLTNAMHAVDNHEAPGPAAPGAAAGERRILIRAALRENGRVRLEIADSGPGLPEGSERIFDPFYTTKDSHQGMGLGLSIVHGLATLWGAEVSARPRDHRLGGAVFYVDLLVAGEENGKNQPGAPAAFPERKTGGTGQGKAHGPE